MKKKTLQEKKRQQKNSSACSPQWARLAVEKLHRNDAIYEKQDKMASILVYCF